MKKLYSFSGNPLNTERFLYMAMKNKPKAKVEGLRRAKEGPKAATGEVAKTADKLNTLLTKLDKFTKKYPTNVTYKKLHAKLLKINDRFQNIEAIKNGEYTDVLESTLSKINNQMDWNVDIRKFIRKYRALAFENVYKSFLNPKSNNRNLSHLKDLVTLLPKNYSKTLYGMKLTKYKNKITIKYGKVVKKFTYHAVGKNLAWEFKDKNGEKIPNKPPKQIALGGLQTKTTLAGHYYYNPKSTKATFYKQKPTVTAAPKLTDTVKRSPTKVKVLGAKAKPTLRKVAVIEIRPTTALGKRAEGKIKHLQNWLKLKIGMARVDHNTAMKSSPEYRNAFNGIQTAIKRLNAAIREKSTTRRNQSLERINNELNLVANNSKTQFPAKLLPKKAVAKKALKLKNVIIETPETKKALKKWGQKLGIKISKAANELYGRITLAKKFLSASKEKDKMKHLTRYKNALAKVGKAIKSTNGTDIIKAANKLTDAYKLIPSELSKEWKDKFKVKITAPPSTKERIALSPSLLKPQEIKKAPKKAVAAKSKPAPKPKVAIKKAVAAKPKPAPKPKVAIKKAVAAKEKKEVKAKRPSLKKWASQKDIALRNIRKFFILGNGGVVLQKVYGEHAVDVMTRINEINRGLRKPNISFMQAVKLRRSLMNGFRHLQKTAKEKKIYYTKIDSGTRDKISEMTVMDFPPAPKNPTVAEQKVINKENNRVAKLNKLTNYIDI